MTRPERDAEQVADAATRSVLGVAEFLDRIEPDSRAARALLAAGEWYGPGDESAWRREMAALRTADNWVDERGSHRSLRRALSELPTLAAVVDRLQGDGVLGEGGLFEVKQFAYYGRRVLEWAGELVADLGGTTEWRDRFDELVGLLHPGGEDSPRFHLSGELDPDLADALQRRRELEAERRDRRATLESDVVDDLGGSFDLRGRYRPPETLSEEALESHAHLASRDDGWYAHSDRLEDLEEALAEATRTLEAEEERVRRELTEKLRDWREWLVEVEGFLARLDLRVAKVRLKRDLDGCWAEWGSPAGASVLVVEGGREPRIEQRAEDEDAIQPVDFEASRRPAVVTGPNMGGKSALLALMGLCQWCAQRTLPIPADTFRFTPLESIVYVGSEEPNAVDASRGLSSFGREVRRLADWMERSSGSSLWLLDEVGRGTHPEDGAEMAEKLVHRLAARGDVVIAATHFPGLAGASSVDHWKIRGVVDRTGLESDLAEVATLEEFERALRDAMDFQPEQTESGEVPKDARLVARALGLDLLDD